MPTNVTPELTAKLAAVGDVPILDSRFGINLEGSHWETVQGRAGQYLSSEADGWQLRGPFRRGAVAQDPAPAPTPAPSLAGEWVDASNYTGAFTDQMMQDLRDAGVVGIVIQAITGNDGISYTRQQCQKATDWGFLLAGYVWCFPGGSAASMRGRLAMFNGFNLVFLALDAEQAGLTRADVDRDLALCDASTGQVTWLYSGKWFFDQQGWSRFNWWADRPLWDSNYDHIAQVDVDFRPYGGWSGTAMKQFAGTSTIGHVHEIDLDQAA